MTVRERGVRLHMDRGRDWMIRQLRTEARAEQSESQDFWGRDRASRSFSSLEPVVSWSRGTELLLPILFPGFNIYWPF